MFRQLLVFLCLTTSIYAEKPFFRASKEQPYHLSVGAVLFDQEGRIACHHFKEILGFKDIYILMRESVEDNESPLATLHRGLMEEFGATARPIAFLGCLSGYLDDFRLPFEKTTLYIACQLDQWTPQNRDPNDPEADSIIEWLEPNELIRYMQEQGRRFNRVDVDESEMIKRALPYTEKALRDKHEHSYRHNISNISAIFL
jgi:8-oxo-dGTP pyrophosphatase MutT (NUDIX family)